jgi:hypothetical protein
MAASPPVRLTAFVKCQAIRFLHGNLALTAIVAAQQMPNIQVIKTKGDAMTRVIRRSRQALGSVGHFVNGVFSAVDFAREAQQIVGTPDNVFRARGTTRERVLRDFLSTHM